MEEVGAGQRKLHNEVLHNLHAPPNIINDKNRKDEMGGHEACMGEMCTKFWSENLKGRDHLEDTSIDRKILE
jgi:hypothetical protein